MTPSTRLSYKRPILPPGSRLGPYAVQRQLGAGGMGEVYLAADERLQRRVAIKVVTAGARQDAAARDRFLREARAAAACEHANICTIYEIGETDDGLAYLAMAYYEGQTLRERLAAYGALPVAEAVEIATEIAKGLERAHEAGLVHRDIKPANVMLTTRGEVKILDFGLARIADETQLTAEGVRLGTVAYMSPEQASAKPMDHRTDVWSLGVVLYEMLKGERPFDGATTAVLVYGILNRDQEPVTSPHGALPEGLVEAVRKALAKDPAVRFASALDLAKALAPFRDSSAARSAAASRPVATVAATDAPTSTGGLTMASARIAPSIAVLPFTDLSPERDQGWLCEGIAEEILTTLTRINGIRVVARASAFQFKEQAEDARKIGRALQVKHLLLGSVRVAGPRLRVTVQLVETAEGYQLWSERFDVTLDDVFAMQDQIARTTVDHLKVHFSAVELVAQKRIDPEAYSQYLKGRHHLHRWSLENMTLGIQCFNTAIGIDPNYAQPYAGLADVYMRQALSGMVPPRQVMPKAAELVATALSIDDTLVEAHYSRAWHEYIYNWDFPAAAASFERALALGPGNETVRTRYSLFLSEQGRFEEAVGMARKVLDNAPLSAEAHLYLVHALYMARRHRECVNVAQRALELQPAYFPVAWYIGLACGADGRPADAVEVLRKAAVIKHPFTEGNLAWLLGLCGETAEARAITNELEERRTRGYFPAPTIAYCYLGLKEFDKAIDWLETAYEDRDPHVLGLKVFAAMDPLRGHPRFDDLIRRVNAPFEATPS